jgi:type II secretory ATPase GspE/PulE/Tfp pilus assembly ATPase PilB-like protein
MKLIGQLLCERSYLDDESLAFALKEQELCEKPVGQILLALGYITQSQLNEAIAVQAGLEVVDLTQLVPTAQALKLVPAEIVSKYKIMPLDILDGSLTVAMSDPFDTKALAELRAVTAKRITRKFGIPALLEKAILKHYGSHASRMMSDLAPAENPDDLDIAQTEYSTAQLNELSRAPSLVNLVNLIILEAIQAKASDIHIEPFAREVKIKYRVDGVLVEKTPSGKRLQAAIVSRIKILAGMNIAERFVPQDGHIEFMAKNGKVDLRVSTVPTIFGESVTMRILDRSTSLIELESLGMASNLLKNFNKCLKKSHGIVLVSGPTGSGKTTTLYAAINQIYSPSLKIITIEDPVEYQLDGVIQIPVNPKRKLTFATGLRHILRQDPDIIMVGEIRDRETADIAVRAALTGHLVFSTIHTNDAAGAVTRLIDMGVEPFLLASSLEAVVAQRLVRKICPSCKEPYDADEKLLAQLNGSLKKAGKLYHGKGCSECMNTGLSGRLGIFELLNVTDKLRELIAAKCTSEQLSNAAAFENMRKDGINKVVEGKTTPAEVFRVTQSMSEE